MNWGRRLRDRRRRALRRADRCRRRGPLGASRLSRRRWRRCRSAGHGTICRDRAGRRRSSRARLRCDRIPLGNSLCLGFQLCCSLLGVGRLRGARGDRRRHCAGSRLAAAGFFLAGEDRITLHRDRVRIRLARCRFGRSRSWTILLHAFGGRSCVGSRLVHGTAGGPRSLELGDLRVQPLNFGLKINDGPCPANQHVHGDEAEIGRSGRSHCYDETGLELEIKAEPQCRGNHAHR